MSQTKYKLENDLKATMIGFIRGYDRRRALYQSRRAKALQDISDNEPRLPENIDNMLDTLIMNAIDQAKLNIGNDVAGGMARAQIREAIWDSCIYGRNFNFNYYILPIGRDNFYERRRKFLYEIAVILGMK